MNGEYRKALRVSNLSREQVAQVCVELKRRIQGKFLIIEEDEDKIVFGNTACPFGDKVIGRIHVHDGFQRAWSYRRSKRRLCQVELQQAIARPRR
jgi:hypothetical protein